MHKILVTIPTYHGVSMETVRCLFDMRTEAEKAGHSLTLVGIERMPLDLARNELTTVFLASTCDCVVMLDDDCQVDPTWIACAIELMDAGCEIVSAPCRLRGEQIMFNVTPITPPRDVGGSRVMECVCTGLGCVLVSRHVFEIMHERMPKLQYRSHTMPDRMSCALFQSAVVPIRVCGLEETGETPVYVLDDRAWSLRARAAGFTIYASIDVETAHAGYKGNFGAEVDKFEAAKVAAQVPGSVV
jgi:hypothetical protein